MLATCILQDNPRYCALFSKSLSAYYVWAFLSCSSTEQDTLVISTSRVMQPHRAAPRCSSLALVLVSCRPSSSVSPSSDDASETRQHRSHRRSGCYFMLCAEHGRIFRLYFPV
ncbi:hypothetical protein ID866_12318 [Astraeus odoratus]|nr:hypothetical protein ID866_12318 [Astraeus odoratus]